jgi:hypothetical protein
MATCRCLAHEISYAFVHLLLKTLARGRGLRDVMFLPQPKMKYLMIFDGDWCSLCFGKKHLLFMD